MYPLSPASRRPISTSHLSSTPPNGGSGGGADGGPATRPTTSSSEHFTPAPTPPLPPHLGSAFFNASDPSGQKFTFGGVFNANHSTHIVFLASYVKQETRPTTKQRQQATSVLMHPDTLFHCFTHGPACLRLVSPDAALVAHVSHTNQVPYMDDRVGRNGLLLNVTFEAPQCPVRLITFTLKIGPLASKLPDAKWRSFLQGYQSWNLAHSSSPATDVRTYSFLSRIGMSGMMLDVQSPLWGQKRGMSSSGFVLFRQEDSSTQKEEEEQQHAGQVVILFGFLSGLYGVAEFLVTESDTSPEIDCVVDFDCMYLSPSVSKSESFVILGNDNPIECLDWYARLCTPPAPPMQIARQLQSRLLHGPYPPVGWCSWYAHHRAVSAQVMTQTLDMLDRDPEVSKYVRFVQIDDGFEPEIGDWLAPSKKFPEGLQAVASKIKSRGYEAGIWVAPFMGGRPSQLFKQHPEWFLKEEDGEVPYLHWNPQWGRGLKGEVYALDLSHPGVLDYITHVFSTLKSFGFTFFKLDFLTAGARRGVHYDDRVTRVEAYVKGLETIRKAVGPDVFLLGCGAPQASSVLSTTIPGLDPSLKFPVFDAMRIAQDTETRWVPSLVERNFAHDWPCPCVSAAMAGDIGRWWANGRLWAYNDPDVLLLQNTNTTLTYNEIMFQATLLGMGMGMLVFGDKFELWNHSRRRIGMKLLPPTTLRGWPLNVMTETRPSVFVLDGCPPPVSSGNDNSTSTCGNAVYAFLNFQDNQVKRFNLARCFKDVIRSSPLQSYEDKKQRQHVMNSPFCAFDFWAGKVLCVVLEQNPEFDVQDLCDPDFEAVSDGVTVDVSQSRPERKSRLGHFSKSYVSLVDLQALQGGDGDENGRTSTSEQPQVGSSARLEFLFQEDRDPGGIGKLGRELFSSGFELFASAFDPRRSVWSAYQLTKKIVSARLGIPEKAFNPYLVSIIPHGVGAFQIVPLRDGSSPPPPILVGCTLHLTALVDRRVTSSPHPTIANRLVITGSGELALSQGSLHFLFPDGRDVNKVRVVNRTLLQAKIRKSAKSWWGNGYKSPRAAVGDDDAAQKLALGNYSVVVVDVQRDDVRAMGNDWGFELEYE